MRQTITNSFLVILTSALLASCQHKGQSIAPKQAGRLDSLIYAIFDIRYTNPQRSLAMIDSLEQTRDLTQNMGDECRAEVYDAMGQTRLAAFYAQRSLKDGRLKEEDIASYYAAYRLLPHIYINSLEWAKALSYATEAYTAASSDDHPLAKIYAPKYLSQIASCQIMLGRAEEGNRRFREAYKDLQAVARRRNDFTSYYNIFAIIGNCIECNLMKDQNDEALKWLPRLEESCQQALQADDMQADYVDYIHQCLEANEALVLAKAGRRQEAESHYRELTRLLGDDTNDFLGIQLNYLKTMGRWQELANLSERLERVRSVRNREVTMDFLRLELSPLFEAELKSGYTARALQTAERIIGSLDSAYLRTQAEDAAQLAVIYETQEKESTITEQEASLNRQRLIATIAVSLLVVLALLLYLHLRRRAARRLAKKNEELTIANARAEEASKMKSNFIQQISHEIRTPLNILSGFTQIVTMPGMELDEATKSDINRQITENTDRITGLVNKMLELSDANSRSVIERTDEVPAIQIAAQATEDSGISQAQHLDFDMQLGEGTDSLMLRTNLRQATRALTLLLDNAQKFTHAAEAHHRNTQPQQEEKKSVVLRLSTSDDMVSFTVEDTGIGVPAAEAERIFEEFVQLDEYYDGTGIGLTVARSIARRLGGDVRLDTSYTGGARFIMTLPMTQETMRE